MSLFSTDIVPTLSSWQMEHLLAQLREIGIVPAAGLTLLGYAVWKIVQRLYVNYTSPLRVLHGPKSPSFFLGNMKEILNDEDLLLPETWIKQNGTTFSYHGLAGARRLFTADSKAVNHILTNMLDYQKPSVSKVMLHKLVGAESMLLVEGEHHKLQRRVMNPAFGPAQIRELTPVFFEKSIELRDIWASQVTESETVVRVDALSWLSKMTLDVIGIAGFNYQFNALTPGEKPNELHESFAAMFQASMTMGIPQVVKMVLGLSFIKTRRERTIDDASSTMARIGRGLVDDSKATVIEGAQLGGKQQNRDILTLLVASNTSTALPASQRLTDEDVMAQIPTFLLAGHETTSTATTWALHALTQSEAVQTKLRAEVTAVSSDTPTMDQLNALSYLDYVVKETLRMHGPVPGTARTAVKDDIVPLSTPVTDRNGRVLEGVHIRKGETVFIPIHAMNRSESTWGADASEFRPERWDNVPDAAGKQPGVWGGMSFGAGPRACIAYRFAVLEMKTLLFTLIRAFELELAVPGSDIGKKAILVQRPFVKSEPAIGAQMPILVRSVRRA